MFSNIFFKYQKRFEKLCRKIIKEFSEISGLTRINNCLTFSKTESINTDTHNANTTHTYPIEIIDKYFPFDKCIPPISKFGFPYTSN